MKKTTVTTVCDVCGKEVPVTQAKVVIATGAKGGQVRFTIDLCKNDLEPLLELRRKAPGTAQRAPARPTAKTPRLAE